MSDQSKRYHSINIGEINTWDDWHIVPSSRPLVNPPSVKTQKIQIPGGNGDIDLSESLTGYPVFSNRTGSWTFEVLNDFKPWYEAYTDIMTYLHGQVKQLYLDDDPDYYYTGRLVVNSWNSAKDNSNITISYDLAPFKWSFSTETTEEEFDPYDQVEYPFDWYFTNKSVSDQTHGIIVIEPPMFGYGAKAIRPIFTVQSDDDCGVMVNFIDVPTNMSFLTIALPDGTTEVDAVEYHGRAIAMEIWTPTGSGTVSLTFRKGKL